MVMKVLAPWVVKFGLEVIPAPDAIPPLPTMADCRAVGMSKNEADGVLQAWREHPEWWAKLVAEARADAAKKAKKSTRS